MKPYSYESAKVPGNSILLFIGSIFLSAAIGGGTYLLSHIFYLLIIFPIGISFITMLAYSKLIQKLKFRHEILAMIFGLLVGLIVVFMFHYLTYSNIRRDFISEGVSNYQVEPQIAEQAFHSFLREETGIHGFFGFMVLRARVGEEISSYFVINYAPVQLFSFSFRSFAAWLYWLLEAVLIVIPVVLMGNSTARRPFNTKINDWYKAIPRQIGSVRNETKESFLSLLSETNFFEAIELIVSEDDAVHPMLEVYINHNENETGDILLTIKETFFNDKGKFKRKAIQQWEITKDEYGFLNNAIDSNFPGVE